MEQSGRSAIVTELIRLIKKSHAHVSLEDALAGLPSELRTSIPDNLPYSIWQLVDHMRIAQKDIVEFSVSADYNHKSWPDDYWSPNKDEISDDEWSKCLKEIDDDRAAFFELLNNSQLDLFSPFEWGEGQNLFKEAILIADHNAYHTAEIVVIRRLLKCWN